jgi:hypothetical protein
MRTTLDFPAAIQSYKQFLSEQGLSTDIVWVFREDVTVKRRRVWVRWPLPPENPRLAEQRYEHGRNKGLGLRLDTFCLAGHRPCCYVWVPQDEIDADLDMSSELKMCVPTAPIHAKIMGSELLWLVITWLDLRWGCKDLGEELPQRHSQTAR